MLSSVIRRTLFRSGTLLSAQRLLPCAISHNGPLTWPVERGFSTTSSNLNPGPNADSEPESKSKSTRNQTRSSKKVTRRDKTQGKTKASAKKAGAKQKVTIKPEDRPPKHPGTPYILWMAEWTRTQLKPENMSAAQDLIRLGAQTWHTVSEYDKQRYKEKSEGLKAEYHQRLQEWRENVNPSVLRELNSRRAKKGRRRIRGLYTGCPISGFLRYSQEVRQNTPRTQEAHRDHFSDVAKLAGSQWRAMSETEKAKYNDPANAERAAWREKRKAEGHAKQ